MSRVLDRSSEPFLDAPAVLAVELGRFLRA